MLEHTGQQLGNYRLIRRLGRGGAAEVYLGEHVFLKTRAAIKVLQAPQPEQDTPAFLREAQVVAGLVHPHIVRVLDFGVQDETFYLVMEYAPRGTLRQNYPHGTRLSQARVVDLVKQIASALQYAHDRNVIHCDVKPENVLLGKDEEALLSDFGIATVLHTMSGQQVEHIAGTIAYMAPEQFEGKPQRTSDQYALAVITYEWLSGERPFQGNIAAISNQHLRALAAPLGNKVPGLPAAVDEVLRVAMEKDAARRFSSIQAFARALEQACDGSLKQSGLEYAENGSPIQAVATPAALPLTTPVLEKPYQQLSETVADGHIAAVRQNANPQKFSDAYSAQADYSDQLLREASLQPTRSAPDKSRRAFVIGATGGAVAVGVLVSLVASGRLTSLFARGSVTATPIPRSGTTPQAKKGQTQSPTPTNAPLGSTLITYAGRSNQVTGVCWSPLPGRTLAFCSIDGSVTLWDVTANNVLRTRSQGGEIYAVVWSPNGQMLASAGSNGIIEIWNAASGSLIATCLGHSLSIFGLAWSPDSQRLVSASQDQSAIVWHAAGGNQLASFKGHTNAVWAVAWAPNGSAVATGGIDGKVHVWNPENGALTTSYNAHSAVRAVDWSPDSSSIAAGNDSAVVQIWQVADGNLLTSYHGHSDHIESVQWSHDGQRIASASADKTAQIWQASNANRLYRYTRHTDRVWSLAWSPDGQLIATSSADKTVKVWQAI